jgi:hypothetical protein
MGSREHSPWPRYKWTGLRDQVCGSGSALRPQTRGTHKILVIDRATTAMPPTSKRTFSRCSFLNASQMCLMRNMRPHWRNPQVTKNTLYSPRTFVSRSQKVAIGVTREWLRPMSGKRSKRRCVGLKEQIRRRSMAFSETQRVKQGSSPRFVASRDTFRPMTKTSSSG